MAAKTITLTPNAAHGQSVSFVEEKPEDAGFLYEPTVSGKVYFTKSALREMGWNSGNIVLSLAK